MMLLHEVTVCRAGARVCDKSLEEGNAVDVRQRFTQEGAHQQPWQHLRRDTA